MRTGCLMMAIAWVIGTLCATQLDAAHVHFIHQSTGGNWLADYDPGDPTYGGGNLRADLESDGHTVTDNWYWGDNAPYLSEWDGLCYLFMDDGANLPGEAQSADIIIIKSCYYPTEYLISEAVLQSWMDSSVVHIVGYFDNHPEQRLIYCSSVPHHRSSGDCPPAAARARGRAWGDWLENATNGLTSYADHGNVRGFSSFALTARDPSAANPNTLQAIYEIAPGDNHMNRAGNVVCADQVRELVSALVPVELASFSAEGATDQVVLRWSTASESENLGFNILRSWSASGECAVVNDALIPARGSPTYGADYRFVDESPPAGMLTYFLEDVSFDGHTVRHGPARVVVTHPEGPVVVEVSRNPTRGPVIVRSTLLATPGATARIYSLTGALIKALRTGGDAPGSAGATWDLADGDARRVPPGVYVVTVTSGRETASTEVVVME